MKKYDPVKQEKEILAFWDKKDMRKKAVDKNKGKKSFYFLDGPPYTSGKIHLGTAWNKSLKDFVTRYKRMKGFDVWDRAGYDMHGLPTEGKVQAKLGMKTKEDILEYGLAKFIKDCKEWAVTNLKQMNKDFERLGVWLDFDNAYQTIANEYIEGAWWLVKKAHEKGRLYEGQMTMTWCGSCQTSLAKHELEYKDVTDKSIYVKFPVKDNEYLVIWTTTPWTIPFNLGVMAHPEIEYVRAKVGDEVWILAEELAEIVAQKAEKDIEIVETFPGKELEGLKYTHPMQDILKHHYEEIAAKAKKMHVVVMSDEYVTTEQGTGLVHMAPGAGPEDYEVGHREGIPPFNVVNENGYYDNTMGPLSGLHTKKDNDKFIDALQESIVAIEDYPHDYAHCWRCKSPILYRTTTQWFFKVEDLIPKMRKLNKEKIHWVPEWAGANQFDSWLANLRDNGITRQRFWGSPLPVWKCGECEEYTVIESRKELREKGANKIPDDLHKPWIDDVTLPCSKCKGTMKRIPDIMDVWIDAGVDSWASLGFPHDDELFNRLYPADFITEGKDQIRGWFNLLFVASMLALEDISFKNCYMTGFINDAQGRKMSKSLGNVISPNEVTEKYGADTFRYYAIGAAAPGLDLNYNFDDVELKRRNLSILWNLHNFVMDMAKTLDLNPEEIDDSILEHAHDEDRYILSKLNSTIQHVNALMDEYRLNEVPWAIEELYLELSRTYIQMVREKASMGTDEDKEVVLHVVYHVLKNVLVLLAPIVPMITEKMYLNFKDAFGLKKESVHLFSWPKSDEKWIDASLEADVDAIKNVIQAGLAAREKAQTGLRWPLSILYVETKDKDVRKSVTKLDRLIKDQVNIKEIVLVDKFDKADIVAHPDYKAMGPAFGRDTQKVAKAVQEMDQADLLKNIAGGYAVQVDGKEFVLKEEHLEFERTIPKDYTMGSFGEGNVYLYTVSNEDLEAEGYAREVVRRIQTFRKEAGLHKKDDIDLYLQAPTLYSHLLGQEKDIEERVGAVSIVLSKEKPQNSFQHSYSDDVKGEKIYAYFKVV